ESKPDLNGEKEVKREDEGDSDIEILDYPPIKKELVDGGNGGMVPIGNVRSDKVLIRVNIVDGDLREQILFEVPSSTRVCDLHLHPDLKGFIKNDKSEWRCEGDFLRSIPISSLFSNTKKRPIELMCKIQREEEIEDKMRGVGESNDLIVSKKKEVEDAPDLIDNPSNPPLNSQSIDNSTSLQPNSIHDNDEV
ncbi:hypothetical protein PFISCL1PPCAC_21792, partial [Pristionchus fissidentatus]